MCSQLARWMIYVFIIHLQRCKGNRDEAILTVSGWESSLNLLMCWLEVIELVTSIGSYSVIRKRKDVNGAVQVLTIKGSETLFVRN